MLSGEYSGFRRLCIASLSLRVNNGRGILLFFAIIFEFDHDTELTFRIRFRVHTVNPRSENVAVSEVEQIADVAVFVLWNIAEFRILEVYGDGVVVIRVFRLGFERNDCSELQTIDYVQPVVIGKPCDMAIEQIAASLIHNDDLLLFCVSILTNEVSHRPHF
jgi:hypothetical protein